MASLSFADARVLVAGATSTLARAVADRLAARGANLHLAARNADEAERNARDLRIRHRTEVSWSRYEATDPGSDVVVLDTAAKAMDGLDVVLVAVGRLGDQQRAARDPDHLAALIEVNFTAVARLLTRAANRLETQGRGMLVAFSSVAGDRGRPSNYAYGAAKAGLTAFLSGLRARLREAGVHVLTVKPGPADTKMTFGREELPHVASPETVAEDVVQAMDRRRNVCYTPPLWRYIMAAVRAVPEALFKRLPL